MSDTLAIVIGVVCSVVGAMIIMYAYCHEIFGKIELIEYTNIGRG